MPKDSLKASDAKVVTLADKKRPPLDLDPFLITGSGRSGTLWLSHVLNLYDDELTVTHEHSGDSRFMNPSAHGWQDRHQELRERFGRNYGEVNSQLRKEAHSIFLMGVRVAIIVRDPRDIFRSIHHARGRDDEKLSETMDEMGKVGYELLELLKLPFRRFRFEHTIACNEVAPILDWIGINSPMGVMPYSEKVKEAPKNETDPKNITLPRWSEWDNSLKDWFYRSNLRELMDRLDYRW